MPSLSSKHIQNIKTDWQKNNAFCNLLFMIMPSITYLYSVKSLRKSSVYTPNYCNVSS